MEVRGRSGNAVKGIQIIHGTVDSDYRGVVGAIVYNSKFLFRRIKQGDRIAQIMINPVISSDITTVLDLSDTERGTNGFGSTGR